MTAPVALTIAGSDSGGGAGIQADLKTFEAHGVYGTSVLTLVTAQNTCGVRGAWPLPPGQVAAQLEAVLDDFPVAAVKTGALGNADLMRVVAAGLRGRGLPLVVDPVMLAKGGDPLLAPDALEALLEELFPLATLITPNVPEWTALQAAGASEALPLLLKGGHAPGETVVDTLRAGPHPLTLTAPRQYTRHTHGTGCTLSAAIAAHLARGLTLPAAVGEAHLYVQRALRAAPGLGAGHGPLGHREAGQPSAAVRPAPHPA
ncbi:bifunctional hydroxymethylpyrimidine kinase/phosphomethylpyrimidine kinase [Deinococcus arcticus]|uniref:hydroxymethylpyrimidine kinase n=1 Tax=Deinococcus arcticus TaxID=2136176 RepID=A0A2T3W5D2_9DEIO|nr:bifunctional hydroxymethylpyrimidine kinase/phosphomethylpyrimidine kinase [Deinococcus arcticus]PTA67098.1 bifunctional hydroxymethylpyrimidine kinase/phosphomethylpyrimidine kinase [Deinococcus arcticus]